MKITLSAKRNQYGAWIVTAYIGEEYAGNNAFYGYTKSEALRLARESVRENGGLGLYRKQLA